VENIPYLQEKTAVATCGFFAFYTKFIPNDVKKGMECIHALSSSMF